MSRHLDPISKCESVGCWSYKLTIFCLAFCKHPKQVEEHFPSAASSGFVSFSRISNGHSTYVIDLIGLTGRLKRLKAAKPIPKNPRILKSAEIVKSLEVAHLQLSNMSSWLITTCYFWEPGLTFSLAAYMDFNFFLLFLLLFLLLLLLRELTEWTKKETLAMKRS